MQKIKNWMKMYSVKSIVLTIVFFVLLSFVSIKILLNNLDHIDQIPYSGNAKLPEPLSTRGLPLPETDVPVVLPPDPGEAGKATLEGTDSNNDGVRDDLEREIVYMYPQNEEVRRVLRAMIKTGQDMITTEGGHEHFERLMMRYFDFSSCHNVLVFGDRLTGYNSTNTDILWNMLKNTKERKAILENNFKKATPFAADASSINACNNLKSQY